MKQAGTNMSGSASLGMMQTTLASEIHMSGVGVHSGRFTTVDIIPADADTGIIFHRTDIGGPEGSVLAHAQNAIETQLCTTIKNSADTEVRMIEHLMAAFYGMGVDNAVVHLSGPEVPIFDGSSAFIVEQIARVGVKSLDKHRQYLEILTPIRVELADNIWAELRPSDSFKLDISIDFDDPGIGQQALQYDMAVEHFADEIAHARTFCMYADVEKMRRAGLGKGGSLDNALVYDNGVILNKDGLRMPDECVKHKALDCLGDMFLVGMPIKGCLASERPGHRLSTLLVQKLLSDSSAYRIVSGADEALLSPSMSAVQMPIAAAI